KIRAQVKDLYEARDKLSKLLKESVDSLVGACKRIKIAQLIKKDLIRIAEAGIENDHFDDYSILSSQLDTIEKETLDLIVYYTKL
ncbi:MAG: hypothetical protein ACRDBG_27655, partial [Waterburya sp.]